MCDVSNQESVTNIKNWINELWINSGFGPIPFVILGNKVDLRGTGVECLTDQTMQKVAEGITTMTRVNLHFNVTYLPTSAKTGENISNAFKQIALQMISHRKYLKKYQ